MMLLNVMFLLLGCASQVMSNTGYIDYYEGTLNVILSAPHGGSEKPSSIPDRDKGCYINGECVWTHTCGTKSDKCKATTVTDMNTLELTLKLRDELYNRFKEYPHVIINRLKRTKLDPNRDRDEASFNVPVAGQAWDEFQGYIDHAKANITKSRGPGIFFDIHGHGKPEQWAMLGYLIRGNALEEGSFPYDQTSIKALVERVGVENYETILRGVTSFGAFLEDEGFDAVPSVSNPHPNGASFYSGGYNTRRHGSRDGGIIDAIQIESASTFRRERFNMYVSALGEAIQSFVLTHYESTSTKKPAIMVNPSSAAASITHNPTFILIVCYAIFTYCI